jgi:endonuclease/exonuclease/phosphatase family metal-dependent hydrolase
MIATLKSRNVDVAGLQEFQSSQRKAFKRAAPGYDMYTQGSTSIVWKQDRFRLVSSRAVTMPYFGGKPAKRPIVQLEDRTTGKRMWVMNIHNPADVRQHQNQGKFRTEALRRELEIVEQLRKDGLPVFLVGDFNNGERARDVLTAGSELTASDPIGGDTQIDWVFGAGHQGFTSHEVDRSTQSSRISDHPLVVATAQL